MTDDITSLLSFFIFLQMASSDHMEEFVERNSAVQKKK